MAYSEKLKNPKWQKKRLEILNRDNFTCIKCGDKETTLQIHHFKYYGEPWEAKNEDLITVCKHCHYILEDSKKSGNEILEIHNSITSKIVKVNDGVLFYSIEDDIIKFTTGFFYNSPTLKLLYNLSTK